MNRTLRIPLFAPPGAMARSLCALFALFAWWAGLVLAPAAADAYQDGEKVVVTGLVTDAQGVPLPNLRVVLEASRHTFSLRQFGRVRQDSARQATTTNERGEYSLEWPWNSYYNHFELAVGVAVKSAGGERFQQLATSDLTRRIEQGSPVVAAVAVEDTGFLRALDDFLDSVESQDERAVYAEMGKPDQIEITNYPDHREVSWWYFESGRAYRFRDGALEQVVSFSPIPPLPSATTGT